VTAYSRKDDETVEQMIGETELFRPALLPGFELSIAELMAAADRWAT
jgi:hypothetical protein